MQNRARCSCALHVHRGFTLVEAIVTIGIIVFLAGLTVTAATSVNRRMEVQQTQNTLQLLDIAMQEWEATAGRKLSWKAYHDDEYHYSGTAKVAEMNATTPEVFLISEMLDSVTRDPAAFAAVKRIDNQHLYTYNDSEIPPWISADSPAESDALEQRFIGSLTVLDAWGYPIYATHPGRPYEPRVFPHDAHYQPDADGTIRTYKENKYGVGVNRRMCFVSAGPDREFGYLAAPAPTADFKATEDNLYSYPPARP